MREPERTNTAQHRQDRATKTGVAPDPLANGTTDIPSGGVHGGDETKPGQMDGDEDISPNAPQDEIEARIHRTLPPAD